MARSVEFDALTLVAAPAPGQDAHPDLDGKAGTPVADPARNLDPQLVLLLQETFRLAKPIVLAGPRTERAGGLRAGPAGAGGVVESSAEEATAAVGPFLAKHRFWERFVAPNT